MSRKLRNLIESAIAEVLSEVTWDRYEGEDIEATCNHCGQNVWLVWETAAPSYKWTECGGIGEGSCTGRFGEERADTDDDIEIEPAPETMRSPSLKGISSRPKRSV